MAPAEFHRYIDARGDTIIYKFDPEVARKPNSTWPNDSAVTVYHQYIIQKPITVNHHSDLLPLDCAMDRWRSDKQALQPTIGMVMHKETDVGFDGRGVPMSTQYVWKGWGHGEGYRRGWAKLQVQSQSEKQVTVASQYESGGQLAVLTEVRPCPRPQDPASRGTKERKDSKDLQYDEFLHTPKNGKVKKTINNKTKSQTGSIFEVLADMPNALQLPQSSGGERHESAFEDRWPPLQARTHTNEDSNQPRHDRLLSKAQKNNRRKREAKKKQNRVDELKNTLQDHTPAHSHEPKDGLVQLYQLQQALRGATMSQLIQEIAKKQLGMRGVAQGTFSIDNVLHGPQGGSTIQWRSGQQQSAANKSQEPKDDEEGTESKASN